MKKFILVGLLVGLLITVGSAFATPPTNYSEETVTGHSNGNHALDCTIIRPWDNSSGPGSSQYPVIIWGNGWGGNNNAGETTTDYYKDFLIEWALDGPYIVVAANQWSVRESDILACLAWILDQNDEARSDYHNVVNTSKIGLAGHSQGGGAVVKAGDGEPDGFDITTVVAMNPYGPGWSKIENQDGPVMIIAGAQDTVTPERWTYPVFEAVQSNDQGGLYAVHQNAGHNDLDLHQTVVKLWWQFSLNEQVDAGNQLMLMLNEDPWDTQYALP
jgi:predicted esterase